MSTPTAPTETDDWAIRWGQRLWQASTLAVRDFLFPPACVRCGDEPQAALDLCDTCQRALANAPGNHCVRCGAPIGLNTLSSAGCYHCQRDEFAFQQVLSVGVYRGALRRAIKDAKTERGQPVAIALADLLLSERLTEFLGCTFDAVTAVPQDWGRRVWTVHSAPETIATRLARRLKRPLALPILRKPRPTRSQARSAPGERRRQQRGAFVVREGLSLAGARLLLVDDVLTTGATADAASRALRAAGAAAVTVAVIARGLGDDRDEADRLALTNG